MRTSRIPILLCFAFLVACGGDKAGDAATQGEDAVLPKPGAVSGSVTGMPNPGTANAAPPAEIEPPEIEIEEAPAEIAMGEAVDPAVDAQQALSVLRDYYAAINAGDFARAHAQWGDGGRASGQSLQQFSAGFAGTVGTSVEFGEAGAIEGAAGSRYIQIPLNLEARQADGSLRRYAGSYSLRRSVVDGASAEQQAWHIASADLREVQQ